MTGAETRHQRLVAGFHTGDIPSVIKKREVSNGCRDPSAALVAGFHTGDIPSVT